MEADRGRPPQKLAHADVGCRRCPEAGLLAPSIRPARPGESSTPSRVIMTSFVARVTTAASGSQGKRGPRRTAKVAACGRQARGARRLHSWPAAGAWPQLVSRGLLAKRWPAAGDASWKPPYRLARPRRGAAYLCAAPPPPAQMFCCVCSMCGREWRRRGAPSPQQRPRRGAVHGRGDLNQSVSGVLNGLYGAQAQRPTLHAAC